MKKKIDLLLVTLLLSFVGGFMDAYSVSFRGGKFIFMQTGNLITMIDDLIGRNWVGFWLGFLSFISFLFGVAIAIFILKKKKSLPLLIVLMVVLMIPTFFFPKTDGLDCSWFAIACLGIAAGILLEGFRFFIVPFTPTMMTNNSRLMVEALFENKKKALVYLAILFSFLLGVASESTWIYFGSALYLSPLLPLFLMALCAILIVRAKEEI